MELNEQQQAIFARVSVLLNQERYQGAESELRRLIAEDADNAAAHALLAVSLRGQDRNDEALAATERAIQLQPDFPYPHYLRGQILYGKDKNREARASVEEAIRLDPEDAEFHTLLGWIHLERTDWEAALDSADRALALDANHVGALNLRADVLHKLGRHEEADQSMREAIAEEPESSFSHANLGWRALKEHQYDDAMRCFREALRLRPDNDWAKQGMVLALKSRYPVYGLVLRYFLWMGEQRQKTQWMLIIGLVVGMKVLKAIAEAQPEFRPVAIALTLCYWLFVFLSWTADSLFNLVLRLNPVGRLVLSRDQTLAANWTGGFLGSAVLLGIVAIGLKSDPLGLLALVTFLLTMPVAGSFRFNGGRRAVLLTATAIVAVLGLWGILGGNGSGAAFGLFILGVIGHGWVANLMSVRS